MKKSIYSTTRQASIADDDDRKHQAKIYYLKRLLLLVVIEIVVFKLLPLIGKKGGGIGRKIAKHKIPIAIGIAVLFVISMIPHIIGDLQMSRMRWGLKQWIQDVPGNITDISTNDTPPPTHSDHHEEQHINKQIAQRCKALDGQKKNQSMTDNKHGSGASMSMGMSAGGGSGKDKHSDGADASFSFGMSAGGGSGKDKHSDGADASFSFRDVSRWW